MNTYEFTVQHVRDSVNKGRERWTPEVAPLTDYELVDILLRMKHWDAAEWLAEQDAREDKP